MGFFLRYNAGRVGFRITTYICLRISCNYYRYLNMDSLYIYSQFYIEIHMEIKSYWIFLQRINNQSVSEDGPAVFGHFSLLLGSERGGDMLLQSHKFTVALVDKTHESTWFSKERVTGYGEVLKALSAMASITSYNPGKRDQSNLVQISKQKAK